MTKHCAHPSCTCEVPPGKEFCSDQCRAAQPITAGQCRCQHPGCRASGSHHKGG